MRFLSGVTSVALLGLASLRASASESAPLLHHGLSAQDLKLDVRMDQAALHGGQPAVFALLTKELARDPRPHVKAHYGEFLLNGQRWGAPDGQVEGGLALILEAKNAGSLEAKRILGWELLAGSHVRRDPEAGLGLLLEAGAMTHNANAMLALGEVYLRGLGVPTDLDQAEFWFRLLALQGYGHSLFRLGQVYEKNASPDLAKATSLYFDAANCGDFPAQTYLTTWSKAGDPQATRAYHLYIVTRAGRGARFPKHVVHAAVEYLESRHPDDPAALLALGQLYIYQANGYVSSDYKKAVRFLTRAQAAGLADAEAELAHMQAEGWGLPRNPAQAVATWQQLGMMGNARSLELLGYYSYWGSLGRDILPKDAGKALDYSVRAAELGDAWGQDNAGFCYEFGIGTPVDYACAADYYRCAEGRGIKHARIHLPKVLRAVTR